MHSSADFESDEIALSLFRHSATHRVLHEFMGFPLKNFSKHFTKIFSVEGMGLILT